ncbi:MAG TPA: MFS transporter [Spirochaetota bacterium]|nr:MFS transporter [Spirochaetota bacterium]
MRKRSFTVLRNVAHGANDIYWFILPPLLPVILAQYNLNYGAAGGLLTAYLGTIAIFSFILGKVSDNMPRQRVLGAGFLVASVSLILAGFMGSLPFFILFLLVAGIGVSSFHPAVYASIDETTVSGHGSEYGMFEFWGSVGVFIMFLLHGLLLREMNWKMIIMLTSVPGLVVGSFYFRYRKLLGKNDLPQVKQDSAGDSENRSVFSFVLLLLVVMLRFLGMIAIVNFIPTYLVREFGLDPSLASFATGIYFLGGLIFTPLAGKLSDRWGPFQVLVLITGLTSPFIFLLSTPSPIWAVLLFIFPIGACHTAAQPAQNMLIARLGSMIGKGEAFGYVTAAIAVTSSFSPLLFGAAADRVGLRLSIRLFSLPVLLSFILLVALWFFYDRRAPVSGK